MAGHLYSSSNMGLVPSQVGTQISSPNADHLLKLSGTTATQFDHLLSQASHHAGGSSIRPPTPSHSASSLFLTTDEDNQPHIGLMHSNNKSFHGLMQLPGLQGNAGSSNSGAGLFNLGFFPGNASNNASVTSMNTSSIVSSGFLLHDQYGSPKLGHGHESVPAMFPANIRSGNMSSLLPTLNYASSIANEPMFPQMSATALLQKAGQIGATTSTNNASFLRFRSSSPPVCVKSEMPMNLSASFRGIGGFADGAAENEAHLQDLMNSLATPGSSLFHSNASSRSNNHGRETGYGGFNLGRMTMDHHQHQQDMHGTVEEGKLHQNVAGSDRKTRDFLGVGGMIAGMGAGMQQRDHHHHHLGMDISSFESEMKSGAGGSRPFDGRNLQ